MVSAIVGAVLLFSAGLAVGLAIDSEGGEAEGGEAEALTSQEATQEAPQSTPLKEAREACAPGSGSLRLGDDDHTLMIDRAGAEENPGADYFDVLCIFDELGTPDYVISQVEGTRALDGTQEASFDEYSMFWTFHPDDGLNMTITWMP